MASRKRSVTRSTSARGCACGGASIAARTASKPLFLPVRTRSAATVQASMQAALVCCERWGAQHIPAIASTIAMRRVSSAESRGVFKRPSLAAVCARATPEQRTDHIEPNTHTTQRKRCRRGARGRTLFAGATRKRFCCGWLVRLDGHGAPVHCVLAKSLVFEQATTTKSKIAKSGARRATSAARAAQRHARRLSRRTLSCWSSWSRCAADLSSIK